MTSAEAGITCGVPDERAVRAIDSGGHGSRGLGWREVVGSRESPEVWTKGEVASQPRVLGESAEGEKADASGRVACSCAGRVSQESSDQISSHDTCLDARTRGAFWSKQLCAPDTASTAVVYAPSAALTVKAFPGRVRCRFCYPVRSMRL